MVERGEISTLAQLEAFLDQVGGFHDGVIKEMHWVNYDFVNHDLHLMPCRGSTARLLIQRQWKDPSAVEIELHGIQSIFLDTREFIYDSSAAATGGVLVLAVEESRFIFKRMTYRFASEMMGEAFRFGPGAGGTITADKLSDPQVADILRAHVAERAEILKSLTETFRHDQRIRAAWLWGSFLRGEQDDLSDLDIWLLLSDGAASVVAKNLKAYCSAAGTVASCGENPNNGPEGGGYLGALLVGSYGLHHVDIYWQPASDGSVPDGPILFNRLDGAGPPPEPNPAAVTKPEETPLEACRGRIEFLWLMLSVAAKLLARDSSSDMELARFPKPSFEEAAKTLGIERAVGEVDWTTPDDPLAKVDLLRHIAVKTALLEAACRAQGMELSTEANLCLRRYFDVVEGIVRGRGVGL